MVFSIFAFSAAAFAVPVFVEAVKDPGGLAAESGSVTELLRSAVDENQGFERAQTASEAKVVLSPKLLKLGQNFVLSVSRIEGGTVQKTSKMRVSAVEDLDLVSQRIVRALLSGESAEDDARVAEVTDEETQRARKKVVPLPHWYLGYGPATSSNLTSSAFGTSYSLGYAYGIDPRAEIGFELQSYFASSTHKAQMTHVAMVLNYYQSDRRHSPYLRAVLGGGVASSAEPGQPTSGLLPDNKASGLTFGAGVGYRFFRTSTVNIAGELSWAMMTSQLSESQKNPHIFCFQAVLSF